MEYFDKGQLMDILNIEQVKADDVYFLPAGRVHYIGKGCLLAEIQQTSDVTYRMYDFDRKDDQGNLRELHTEDSLDAIDFTFHEQIKTSYEDKENEIVKLVSCDYFTANKLHFNQAVERDHSDLDSFVIYVCMDGGLMLEYKNGSIEMQKGDAVLVPAEKTLRRREGRGPGQHPVGPVEHRVRTRLAQELLPGRPLGGESRGALEGLQLDASRHAPRSR